MPEPLHLIDEFILGIWEESRFDTPGRIVDVGQDVLDQKSLLYEFFPSPLQSCDLE